jgi:uncharacterized integral membrane protein
VRLRRPEIEGKELRESFQPLVWIRLVGLSLLVAYVVAFVLENAKAVHVHFVLTTTRVSLIWVILLSLAIGVLAGVVGSQLYRHRRRRSAAREPRNPV